MLQATERETHPAKRKKGKFIKRPPNGFGSRAEPRNVAANAKAKAKAKEKAVTVRQSPSAKTGARATATAGTQPRATSPMMARKGAGEKVEGQLDVIACKSNETCEERINVHGR